MISVCIATYNGARTIHTQLSSIIEQLSEDDEIIISDDHSDDETLRIIESFQNPSIKVVNGPGKNSPIPNFENALQHAKGEYIFLADQDDRWEKGKVKTVMKALSEGFDCVVSDCFVTDEQFNVTAPSFFQEVGLREGFWYNLLVHNYYLGCCMAFNRKVLEKALPFPPHIPMHDIWIGNVAAAFFKVKFLHAPLISFRRHHNNTSCTASPSPYTLREKFLFRLNILCPLFRRALSFR